MQSHKFTLAEINEAQVGRFAQELAFVLDAGDVIALRGDLGAGKTTFARALIRALADDPAHEVPSPTFTLVQTYETPPIALAHFDLYRLTAAEEIEELGFDHLRSVGACLIEWPERAEDYLPAERLEVSLTEPDGATGDVRTLEIIGLGNWATRARRLQAMHELIEASGFGGAEVSLKTMSGDASTRKYARLERAPGWKGPEARAGAPCALLMDWPRHPDGPAVRDDKPYSQIAKLAEDVGPFLAVGAGLKSAGLSAPAIYATDIDNGFILLEDWGALDYGSALALGENQLDLWQDAIDALLKLRGVPADQPLPVGNGKSHTLPKLDRIILEIETDLVPDWLWQAVHGSPMPADVLARYRQVWEPIFETILDEPTGWMLRDYHSPNLILLPSETGHRRAGVIDFQDALQGPLAYDLVSLLQDARLDVSAQIENALLSDYCSKARATEAEFDADRFRLIYAMLGAQRNTKILGIFARLAKRDKKTRYLTHMPRIWGYLERNLAHPQLNALSRWYEEAFPPPVRARPIKV
ncbi:MAG: tRNA (adenosine(37)-N6)-threonylcarbamoyltransferase complex ATPase subunit type 1 TsaE [Alphaproteobacteria bacterium]|nr:tRNA (adenosine(37)-N6)-threonylcarbamoyltransferase complex ATPase subunit type 1 TsaE [Alphaproteobacteria bacterium]